MKTLKLQEMVAKSIKGASSNKMIPITSLMAVELKKNKLTLTTTDATNYLRVVEDKVEGKDFYIVVGVDVFSKLVSKTSVETITLTLKESTLEVKGNGTYSIELPLDEDGKLIRFPEYKFNADAECSVINLSTVRSILTANKPALANTMEMPALTGYYCDDKRVISTDTFKVCNTAISVFTAPALVPPELLDLLSLMTDEKITVQAEGSKMLFTTNNIVVYGVQLDGLSDYPVAAVDSFLETEFSSSCKLPKDALLAVLDRLTLFVTDYDKNGIYLTFTKDGVIVSSKKSTGTELIKYQGSENFSEFSCCADIELLRSQVKAQEGEVVEMWYGHESAVKMTSGKITQIVALLEDDRVNDNGQDES